MGEPIGDAGVVVGEPGSREEDIGEEVQVAAHGLADQVCTAERVDASLRAPARGPSDVELACAGSAAGVDEVLQLRHPGGEVVD